MLAVKWAKLIISKNLTFSKYGCKTGFLQKKLSIEKRRQTFLSFERKIKPFERPSYMGQWTLAVWAEFQRCWRVFLAIGFGMWEGTNGGLGFTLISIFISVNAEKAEGSRVWIHGSWLRLSNCMIFYSLFFFKINKLHVTWISCEKDQG